MSTPTEGTGNYTVPLNDDYMTAGPDAVADDTEQDEAGGVLPVPVHDEPGDLVAEVGTENRWTPMESMSDREVSEEILSHLRQIQDLLEGLRQTDPMELMQGLMQGKLFG